MRFALALAAAAVGIAFAGGFHGQASAEMQDRTGVVPHSRIPAPIVSDAAVRLDVPHIRQLPGLCVPTSSAMILRYFGEAHDPVKLKALAEEQKPPAQRNTTFTYWVDMRQALQRIGKSWSIREYVKADAGFEQGLSDIKRSLRAGNPVMIDVHLGAGHTFVVMGYNDRDKVAYVRDPNLPPSESRVLAYDELLRSWHNHKFADSRSAFYSQR
jgi:peptidase C39-like protein